MKFQIDVEEAKRRRLLTVEEKRAICQWLLSHADADLDAQVVIWQNDYNCSRTSIETVLLLTVMGERDFNPS